MKAIHMNSIRVVLVEDHEIVRQGLRLLVEAELDMLVVGDVSNGRQALTLIVDTPADVVLFDISMPEMNGIELAKELTRLYPSVKLLALTANEDRAYLSELLRIGVQGYLFKRSAARELIDAIRAVYQGRKFLDQNLVSELVGDLAMPSEPVKVESGVPPLSEREEQVIRLIAIGFINKEVAAKLGISIKTVETHKARAMTKLKLQSRTELIRYAAARSWLDAAR